MSKTRLLEKDVGIVFGRWRLVPCGGANAENWELYRMRSEDEWRSVGRYYQHSTIGGAFRYAADCEMKHGNAEAAADVLSALAEYERITQELLDGVREAFSGNDEP